MLHVRRGRRILSNVQGKNIKDDRKVDYCLISDESGVLICCETFYCEIVGLKINDTPTS